jgi:hypothetical protein
MKKTILALFIISTLFASCKKDALTQSQSQCNCGLVVSDRVSDYSVVIRNSCSRNEKRFILAPGDWVNALVGFNYCITNSGRW